MREQADLLDNVADTSSQLNRVLIQDIVTIYEDNAAGRLDETVDYLQCCCFATTRWSDQDTSFALRDANT